jgi:hypothetical protein
MLPHGSWRYCREPGVRRENFARRQMEMKGKIKRAVLLSVLSVSLVPNAFAVGVGWKHLGSDKNNTHYFYKPKTYHVKDNIVRSWTKKEYNVDINAMMQKKIEPDDYTGTKSVVVFEEFNCGEKKKRTIIGKVYEGKDDSDVSRTDWAVVQPGSVDEGLLTALCTKDKGNQAESKVPAK